MTADGTNKGEYLDIFFSAVDSRQNAEYRSRKRTTAAAILRMRCSTRSASRSTHGETPLTNQKVRSAFSSRRATRIVFYPERVYYVRTYVRMTTRVTMSCVSSFSEAVYELRKLQQQHKPVSAFASKLDLEELRHRAPPPESAFEPAEGNPYDRRVQQLLSASDPQGYMPPAVRLEIRGLIERQQVSELLNSAHAGDIERVLQEGIERRHRRQLTPRQVHPLSDQAQPGGSRRGRLLEEVQRQGERALPRSQPENGQYRMPRRDQSSIVHQLQESPALNSLQPAERDRVLSEVNHLVQQHLVTSALSGEFRGVLELHIQVINHPPRVFII